MHTRLNIISGYLRMLLSMEIRDIFLTDWLKKEGPQIKTEIFQKV